MQLNKIFSVSLILIGQSAVALGGKSFDSYNESISFTVFSNLYDKRDDKIETNR